MDITKTVFSVNAIFKKMKGVKKHRLYMFAKGADTLTKDELKQFNNIVDSEYKHLKQHLNGKKGI
jgi:hypothetical protein